MTLELMPRYHFHEVHATAIQASPGRIYEAIKEVTSPEIPPFSWLLLIWWFPTFLTRKVRFAFSDSWPFLKHVLSAWFLLVVDEPKREIIVDRIGQFWRAFGGSSPRIRTAADFIRFSRPGYAKVLLNFRIARAVHNHVNLRTENSNLGDR